jgi:twitching motility two-component system response regulator PilG
MSVLKKIMVIDDSQTIRKSAEFFLKDRECQVILVENGFEALGEIYNQRPDLIFVDLMMPRLGGYETCQMIKQHPDFESIPVIVLSSRDGIFDKARGRMVGANDYLTKPFTKEILLATVDKFLFKS